MSRRWEIFLALEFSFGEGVSFSASCIAHYKLGDADNRNILLTVLEFWESEMNAREVLMLSFTDEGFLKSHVGTGASQVS